MNDDKNIIKDLSKAIGKDLNQVDIINHVSFGLTYKFADENITELGLDLSKLNLDENKLTLVGELVQKLQKKKKGFFTLLRENASPIFSFFF